MQSVKLFLEENKCEEIQVFACKNYICDNAIIATTLGAVHSSAVAQKFITESKHQGFESIVDGTAKDGWVAIEVPSHNIIVHLMTQEKRKYFNLEEFLAKLSKQKA